MGGEVLRVPFTSKALQNIMECMASIVEAAATRERLIR